MCRNPLNELRVPGLIQELALDGVPKAAELPAPLSPPEKGRPGGCGERTGAQQVALRPGALPAALRHRARPRSPLPSARAAHPARLCAHRTLCAGFVSISGPGPRTGPPRHSGRHGAPRGSGPRLGEGRQDGPEAPPRGGRGRTPGSYAREPARSTLRPREWGGEAETRRRWSRCEPTCRLSPLPDEVWDPFPGREMSWSGDLKSLVLTISLTLTK